MDWLPPIAHDPNVWSGRASQEVSSIWFSVLHQCIRPLIGAVHCSGPTWISARGRSLYRTGLDRAIWVTSVRSRREDRSPSLRYLSQTSAGKGLSASLLRHRRLLIASVPWFVLMAVPSFSNQHAAIKPFLVHFFLSGHFFCSTAPQAFFRPNHKSMQPARIGHVKAGRSSRPPSGSAFT